MLQDQDMHGTSPSVSATEGPHARISQECHCLACDYDLRSLSTTGLCPECGTPVLETVDAMARCGFSTTADAFRTKRLMTWLSCALGAIFLLMLIHPFEVALSQASPPIAWVLYFSGDQFAACLFITLCCFLLTKLPRLGGAKSSQIAVLGISMRSASMTSLALIVVALAGIVTEWIGWWKGIRTPRGNITAQLFWWIGLLGRTAFHTWALALVTLSALHFCAKVAARSNQPGRSRGYKRTGAFLALLLIVCALPSAIAETVAFFGGGTTLIKFQYAGLTAALSTLSVGTTALMVAIFARRHLFAANADAKEPSSTSSAFAKLAHDLAGLMFWEAIFLTGLAGIVAIGPFLATTDNAFVFASLASMVMCFLILSVAAELLLIISLSRMFAALPDLGHSWRQIRNVRLAMWLAFLAFFVLSVFGSSHKAIVLLVGAIPVVYIRVSHKLLARLDIAIKAQLPITIRWFEPTVATVIGALTLLYYLIMESGRSLTTMGATRIIMGIKDGVGSLACAVAIWAFAQLCRAGLRLRRQAAARMANSSPTGEQNEAAQPA